MSGNICAATNSPSPCSKATTTSSTNPAPRGASSPTTPNASHQSHPELGRRSILEADGITPRMQPSHDLVELFEVAVADVHRAAGIAMINADREAKRVADALFQRNRVEVLYLASARFLRFPFRHPLDMRQRFGLTHVEALLHNTLGSGSGIGHADQRPRVAG